MCVFVHSGPRLGWCGGLPPVQSPVWSDDKKGRRSVLVNRTCGLPHSLWPMCRAWPRLRCRFLFKAPLSSLRTDLLRQVFLKVFHHPQVWNRKGGPCVWALLWAAQQVSIWITWTFFCTYRRCPMKNAYVRFGHFVYGNRICHYRKQKWTHTNDIVLTGIMTFVLP